LALCTHEISWDHNSPVFPASFSLCVQKLCLFWKSRIVWELLLRKHIDTSTRQKCVKHVEFMILFVNNVHHGLSSLNHIDLQIYKTMVQCWSSCKCIVLWENWLSVMAISTNTVAQNSVLKLVFKWTHVYENLLDAPVVSMHSHMNLRLSRSSQKFLICAHKKRGTTLQMQNNVKNVFYANNIYIF
jgi:hypothetical protein